MRATNFELAKKIFDEAAYFFQGRNTKIPDGMIPSHKCHCAYTAMLDSSLLIPESVPKMCKLFIQVNGIPENIYAYGIPAWNDAPERTKEDVLAAFDKVIFHLEKENL